MLYDKDKINFMQNNLIKYSNILPKFLLNKASTKASMLCW